MAFDQRGLDDYIDVAQRIADFRERYAEGSLGPLNPAEPWRIVQAEGFDKDGKVIQQSFVVVVAAAYRTPDDPRPGVGMAWEVFPGRTPYTRGSELMNAETSAWGRAIIAVGASDSKRGVASRDEVRNRRAERDDGLPVNADGSLSRSQTTDEEKQAAGVMTGAQQAEHAALRPKRDRPAERGPDPDAGKWEGPQGELPVPEPETSPGTASPDQLRKIGYRMTEAGLSPGDARVLVGEIVGRPVASRKELSFTEAAKVLKELDKDQAAVS